MPIQQAVQFDGLPKSDVAVSSASRVRLGASSTQPAGHVYRAGQPEPQLLDDPDSLPGEDVLPAFPFRCGSISLIYDQQH